MPTTTRGVPYPSPSDPNNIPEDLQALAEWVDENTGAGAGGDVDLDQDFGPFAAGKGILLTSPDGTTVVRVRIDNTGELVTEDADGGGGDPGGGSTTPDQIAGLLAWYKSSDLALSNGAAVTLWPDAAGANDMDSGVGISNSPLYATTGINGHPAVHFVQASGQSMRAPSTLGDEKPFTAFFVLKAVDFAQYAYLLQSAGAAISLRLNQTTGFPNLDKKAVSGIGTATAGPAVNTGAVVCCRYDGSGNWAFFIDGVAAGSGTNDQTFGTPGDVGVGDGFNGYIGEWMLYSAALSAPDRAAVEDYLSAQWGTP